MKEQSHKDEMSSLLKADFERLRARGVATTLAPPAETPAEEGPLAEEHAPEPIAVMVAAEPDPIRGEPEVTGGWLRRLLG